MADRELLELADKEGLIVDFWNERVINGLRFNKGHRDWIYASECGDSLDSAITRAAAQMQLEKEKK